MYKKVFLILCSVILLVTIINCGSDDEDKGKLNLYNDTSLSISELSLKPSLESTWGSNHLDSPIPSGGSYTLSGIRPDTYDAKATIIVIDPQSRYYGYLNSATIVAAQTYDWHIDASSFSGSLKIVNQGNDVYIHEIYVKPTDSDNWGLNQIPPDSIINPGYSAHLYDLLPGYYDVQIVWDTPPDSFYYQKMVSPLTLTTIDAS